MALWASSDALQALNCILPHSSPIHSQMWWSCILLTSPSTGKPHWLWLLSVFSLICASVVSPRDLQLPVFLIRQGMLAGYFSLRWGCSICGTTSSLVQGSSTSLLWCSPTTPFHLKQDLILNFYQSRLRNVKWSWWADNRTGGTGCRAAPHAQSPPHHPGSTSDSGPAQKHWRQSVSGMHVSCGDYRKDVWPMENTGHDTMATTLPSHSALAETLLGVFALHTLSLLIMHWECQQLFVQCLLPLWAIVFPCLSFPASRRW